MSLPIFSLQKDFWTRYRKAPNLLARMHHSYDQWTEYTPEELASKLEKKKLLGLTHGYNNSKKDVLPAYFEIREKILGLGIYDDVFGIAWPGGVAGFSYYPARMRADNISTTFNAILHHLCANGCQVDIMTHSLGARVALTALETSSNSFVGNLFLTAPAVRDTFLAHDADVWKHPERWKRIHVMHSENDSVLKYWFRVAEFGKALGLSGPAKDKHYEDDQLSRILVVNFSDVVKSHSGYRQADEMYDYIKMADSVIVTVNGGMVYVEESTARNGESSGARSENAGS